MIEQGTPFATIAAMVRTAGKPVAEIIQEPVLVMVTEVPSLPVMGVSTKQVHDMDILSLRQTEALRQAPSHGLVFFLRKREAGIFTDKIGLGRTRNVDLFIPSVQISQYHAFFSLNSSNTWTITDADSRNGTRVEGERLVAGVAKPLHSGNRILAGGIEFIFYLPAEFVALCRNLVEFDTPPPRGRFGAF